MEITMVRCFVTGGTGFLGSHIVRQLAKAGHEIDILVRPTSTLDLITGLPVCTVEGDVTNLDSLFSGLSEDCELLFHNAAIMSDWGGKQHYHAVNVEGTRNILEVVRRRDIPKLIHVSTAAFYKFTGSKTPMNEDFETKPSNEYQKSKLIAEGLVREYIDSYGIKAAMIRPPAILGYGDMYTGPQLITYLKRGTFAYFGDGRNCFSVAHAEDAARCILLAAEQFDKASGESYNVVSFVTEIRTLIESLCDELGVSSEFRNYPYGVLLGFGKLVGGLGRAFLRKKPPLLTSYRVKMFGSSFVVDDSKARRDLGYLPEWNLESTVKDMVAWGGFVKPR
jgi:nucleoside-diphosphate-sugar epimerase